VNNRRNQLFWMLIRTVVIRTIRDRGFEAVSSIIGVHEVVGSRLGCRIGRIGSVGCLLREGWGAMCEAAENLVSRDVVEAMYRHIAPVEPFDTSGFQHAVSSNDIRFNKDPRSL